MGNVHTEILEEKNFNIRILTIDNPDAANALSLEVISALETELRLAENDEKTRAIILTGKGKFFSAGGDVKKMKTKEDMFSGEGNELRRNYRLGIQRLPKILQELETPVIAMVNGPAVGAGCDLTTMCDLRVAGKSAKFSVSFTKLGLIPGDGGTYFLPRIVGLAKATEMILTGRMYSSEDAKTMGLVHELVSDEELKSKCIGLAKEIAVNSPMAVAMAKRALRTTWTADLHQQLDLLSAYQGICQSSHDHLEGLNSLLEKREPEFKNQ